MENILDMREENDVKRGVVVLRITDGGISLAFLEIIKIELGVYVSLYAFWTYFASTQGLSK